MRPLNWHLLVWRYQRAIALAVILGVLLLAGIAWTGLARLRPINAIYVPREITCRSKADGGYCERTGGVDEQGKPWGTAAPPARITSSAAGGERVHRGAAPD